MKVLIGTPIHISKDYSIERWLKNVSKNTYPADLLMVDDSPGTGYIKKVEKLCKKYGISNYRLEHVDLDQNLHRLERIGRCQEIIRQEFLDNESYDALFSWESDILIPASALGKLVKIMNSGNFLIVIHNAWWRGDNTRPDFEMGCTLISRKALEKHTLITPPPPSGVDEWEGESDYFKNRVLMGGGNYALVAGAVGPIKHLDNGA